MTKPDWCPADVWEAACECWETLASSTPLRDHETVVIARAILAERERALEAQSARIAFLEAALVRIAIKDRHYRVLKPKEDGGIRGPGGMIATYALMGVNGSYIGDAAILESYPEAAKETKP